MKRRTEFAVAFIGEDLVCHLAKALARARALHPEFATNASDAAEVILDEVCELDAAVDREGQERWNEEATDVVVTGIRFLNGEYTEEGRRGLEQIFVVTILEGPAKQDHLLMPMTPGETLRGEAFK